MYMYMYMYICVYIYIYISPFPSCYNSIPLTLVFIGRYGGLKTLSHSSRFDYHPAGGC